MDNTAMMEREFMMIIRAALLMIVRAIEKRWMIKQQALPITKEDTIATACVIDKT